MDEAYSASKHDVLVNRGPWEVIITELGEQTDSSAGLTSEEEEDEMRAREQLFRSGEVPSEYWHIQKLVKYVKAGNQTAAMVALCCLRDHDLLVEFNQAAVQDIGGVEVLVNLLETRDLNCKLGALSVLRQISINMAIRRRITHLGGVPLLIANLCEPARDLQILASETLANVAKIRRARLIVNLSGGIPKVVDLLDVPGNCLTTEWNDLSEDDKELVNRAKGGARALWSLSISTKNKEVMRRSGIICLLKNLLKSVHLNVVIPAVGIIENCATEKSYQLALQTENMIYDIVRHLKNEGSLELRTYCSGAIFNCASSDITRAQIQEAGGLGPLVQMANNSEVFYDKKLLAAVTGAIWKCSVRKENMDVFNENNTVAALVRLLHDEDEEVLTNVSGALSECVKYPENRMAMRRCGGLPILVNLLNFTYAPLLANVPCVLKESAIETESMREIEELDGVRLVWSLLKNKSNQVKENAAWALVPLILNAFDSGEMVRSFVGGLELIVSLLKCDDNKVLAAVCAALAIIALDIENLAIITDHGVIPLFADLVKTKDDLLRQHLAAAIANSCPWSTNCKDLGRLGAITPLVGYLADATSIDVLRTTALALCALSKNSFNCITMHESGVVPFMLRAIVSPDKILQEAAAGCLGNIRRLALEAETYHLVDKGFPKEEFSSSSSGGSRCDP